MLPSRGASVYASNRSPAEDERASLHLFCQRGEGDAKRLLHTDGPNIREPVMNSAMSKITKHPSPNISKLFTAAAVACALAPLLAAIAAASDLPVEPIGPSSRKTGMIISEIMYHPR